MRFALALAGDSNEDANFEDEVANAAILNSRNSSSLALSQAFHGTFVSRPLHGNPLPKVEAPLLPVSTRSR
jgi:hypothetical protein